jgi:alpha-methylacyl-CoA racemase
MVVAPALRQPWITLRPTPPAPKTTQVEPGSTFAQRTRDEWCAVFDTSDACVTPVLGLGEAPQHAQARARDSFVEVGGVLQPAPAPRFSATPSDRPRPAPKRGEQGGAALHDWGFDAAQVQSLRAQGLGFMAGD